jgi:hypothetical protein
LRQIVAGASNPWPEVTRGIDGDVRAIAPGEVDAALNAQRAQTAAPPPMSDATFGASPVYYPGTHVAADAAVVSVATGAEAGGIDFALSYVPTAQITGWVVGGRPGLRHAGARGRGWPFRAPGRDAGAVPRSCARPECRGRQRPHLVVEIGDRRRRRHH